MRNLALAGGACLLVALAAQMGWLPRVVAWHPARDVAIDFPLFSLGLSAGIGFAAGALWMLWGSRVGKLAEREAMLDRIDWRGDERVLDVGCGRGLMLIGAARRVPRGAAVGVDLWQAEDLTGNRPDVPLANAEREGVRARVSVETADMRRLPFPDASFDVVVSRAAIHNVSRAPDRAQAVREIARVLKPGGRALVSDIRHAGEYAAGFRAGGCEARRLDSRFGSLLATLCTLGALRPHLTAATKRKE